MRKQDIGTTFSPRHAQQLGLDPQAAFHEILTFPFSVIRLGAYWDEIEKDANEFDFSALQWYMEEAQKTEVEILLTVGVKSPRWPEFYFPKHVKPDLQDAETQEKLFQFIRKTVESTQKFSCLTTWQVENEPLDPSGPESIEISEEFLQKECELLRSLDSRPLLINLWGNDLSIRNLFATAEQLGDVVGLDLYYKQFMTQLLGKNLYRGPFDTDQKLRKIIQNAKKPVWITELQAEPWEKDEAGYFSENPKSFSLEQLQDNWQRVQALQSTKVLFWGSEYWLWKAEKGNSVYIDWMQALAR